jgi:hypothetical protein
MNQICKKKIASQAYNALEVFLSGSMDVNGWDSISAFSYIIRLICPAHKYPVVNWVFMRQTNAHTHVYMTTKRLRLIKLLLSFLNRLTFS